MMTEEAVFQDPKKEMQERREQEYKKSVQLAEELYRLSLTTNADKERMEALCEAIGPLGPFEDHLVEGGYGAWKDGHYTEAENKAAPQFFETLPILNRMAQLHENFCTHNQFFFNAEVMQVSSSARSTLARMMKVANEETLKQLDQTKIEDFFRSLRLILTGDSDSAIELVINFLNQYDNCIAELSRVKELPEMQRHAQDLRDFLKTREFERILVSAVQAGISNRKYVTNKPKVEIRHLEKQLKEMLTKYGFDPDEILDVWNGSDTEYGPEPQIRSNMNTVFALEDQRPGIARLLYEEFGIRNFERYPESMLIAQFDEANDIEKPYGVRIQATHDWNGAFGRGFGTSGNKHWETLFQKIQDRYAFRIVEVKSRIEIARKLIELNRKYGERQKIAFAFIGGHGTKDYITLGGGRRHTMLHREDLMGQGAQRAGSFFDSHPTIVLDSCSTGTEGGIGQELSRVFGAKIIAPDFRSYGFKNIEPILSDEGIDFNVEYNTKGPKEVIGKVYSEGDISYQNEHVNH